MSADKHFLAILVLLTSLIATFLLPTAGAGEIHRLLENGEIARAKALLIKSAKLLESQDEESQQTPLHIAVHRGHVAMVRFLLERGAKVNARAYNRFTPLHLAKKPAVVKLLIEYRADLEAKNVSGRTALQEAASDCDLQDRKDDPARQIVKLLLAAGAEYDILSATHLGDVSRVRDLLNKDPKKALNKGLMG
jgi:ankyrin repeat protein